VTTPGSRDVIRRCGRTRGPAEALPLLCAFRRWTALGALAIVLVAGCGGSNDQPAGGGPTRTESHASTSSTAAQQSIPSAGGQGSRAPHNRADLRFASAMVALGPPAVEAAGVANASSRSPLVRALAGEMRRAQARTVTASTGWLGAWGRGSSPGGGATPSGRTAPGSIGPDDVRRLRHSSDGTLDRLWLQLMSRQERAEVRAARAEVRHGRSTAAQALARTVIARSRVDRVRMRGLLGDQGD
jgi:uncharacterized protein (DUF305 family)